MNEPRSCEEFRARMPELLPGDADPATGAALLGHLAVCARCAREWHELRRIQAAFDADQEPGVEQVAQARLALRRALSRVPRTRSAAPLLLPGRRWLRHAVGFLLAIGCLVPLTRHFAARAEQPGVPRLPAEWIEEALALKDHLPPWMPSFSWTDLIPDLPGAPGDGRPGMVHLPDWMRAG